MELRGIVNGIERNREYVVNELMLDTEYHIIVHGTKDGKMECKGMV